MTLPVRSWPAAVSSSRCSSVSAGPGSLRASALLYAEARRVLADGGRLAVWDIVAGEDGAPDFPVPWADRPEYSHLTTSDRLRAAIGTAGFEIEQWHDLTGQAAAMMQAPATWCSTFG
jgi:hypothetical protein